MKQLLTLLAMVALIAGCAGRTAMYDAPDQDADVAVVGVKNQISKESSGDSDNSWQAPGSNQSTRAGVFKVDGERTNEMGGEEKARLRPGQHSIQVFADSGGSLRFGALEYQFEAGKTYSVRLYRNKTENTDYRAELVNTASPDQVLEEVNF